MERKLMKCLAVILIFGLMAATGAIAGDTSITGTVTKAGDAFVISGDDGATYNVKGADLADLDGKAVKATGTLEEGPAGKTLTVTSIEPAEKPAK